MIIRHITIRNWRAISHFEMAVEPGLNLLKGPNEAGKSSIVEAIGWALHRDLVGGARIKDEIAPVIPTGNPNARPEVELLLEFPGCTATISKVLAQESAQRECALTVRREGKADENFDQTDAQTQLKILMAHDGQAPLCSSTLAPLEGDLLLSAQGAGTRFVEAELSAAARAAATSVAVGEDGVLALTARLERVRQALRKKKEAELNVKLSANAVDAAKKQTEAGRIRDELQELRDTLARYSAIEAKIGALRATIEKLKAALAAGEPRVGHLQSELEGMRARHTAQIKADGAVAEVRRRHDEAKVTRDQWQARIDLIARYKSEQLHAAGELQAARAQLELAEGKLAELQTAQDTAWQEHRECEQQVEVAGTLAANWSLAHEVCVAFRERKNARIRLEQLEVAQGELHSRQTAAAGLQKAPTRAQINLWREQFAALQNIRGANFGSIRLALRLQRGVGLEWQSDGGEIETGDAVTDEEFVIGGAQTISVVVPGVGCIDVVGEGTEGRKQQGELDGKLRSLEAQLKPFGARVEELPEAFAHLEERCEQEADAKQKLQFATTQWQSLLAAGESLEDTRAGARDWDIHWKSAKVKFEAVRATLPTDIKITEMTALRERDRWRESEAGTYRQLAQFTKTHQEALAVFTCEKNLATQAQLKITHAEETQLRAAQQLAVLQINDSYSDELLAQKLDELNTDLYRSKIVRDEAIAARESLGAPVSDEELGHAAHEAEKARAELQHLVTELAERRMELRGHCEQDPQTESERLEFEIGVRTAALERHESRLRGIKVLEAAVEAERHRMGRELATPLNRFLSPWLSELRGKETHLEFDENGGRIVGIRTSENGSTHSLPFGSHSGGMQEQTALVLRLILARMAAQKLPSQRLPILLDDPLTQTDTTRRAGLWRVLREASSHLQILFVTCHEAHLPGGEAHHIQIGNWQEATTEKASGGSDKPATAESEVFKPKRIARKIQASKALPPKAEQTETLALW